MNLPLKKEINPKNRSPPSPVRWTIDHHTPIPILRWTIDHHTPIPIFGGCVVLRRTKHFLHGFLVDTLTISNFCPYSLRASKFYREDGGCVVLRRTKHHPHGMLVDTLTISNFCLHIL